VDFWLSQCDFRSCKRLSCSILSTTHSSEDYQIWKVNRGATSSSFRGGQFSWNFIRWRHRDYSTVVQLFRKRSHIIIMCFCPQTRSP